VGSASDGIPNDANLAGAAPLIGGVPGLACPSISVVATSNEVIMTNQPSMA
jgi:hypothetical protein